MITGSITVDGFVVGRVRVVLKEDPDLIVQSPQGENDGEVVASLGPDSAGEDFHPGEFASAGSRPDHDDAAGTTRHRGLGSVPPMGTHGPDVHPDVTPDAKGGGEGGLKNDRAKYLKEMADKPGLASRVLQFSLGENTNPEANQAVIETMMNRASVRHTSLEAQLKYVDQGGYYPRTTGSGGARNLQNARLRAMAEANLRAVMGGSNVSSYATDNSSAGLAVKDRYGAARGGGHRFFWTHDFGGDRTTGHRGVESFYSPGFNEPGFMASHSAWKSNLGTSTAVEDQHSEIPYAHGPHMAAVEQPPTQPRGALADTSNDLAYVRSRGGHPTGAQAPGTHPELTARMAAAGHAYEAQTGQRARFGEMDRDVATQAKYYAA